MDLIVLIMRDFILYTRHIGGSDVSFIGIRMRIYLYKFYKKILERQIMQNTPILDVIERFLNPVLGKSLSMYFKNTP